MLVNESDEEAVCQLYVVQAQPVPARAWRHQHGNAALKLGLEAVRIVVPVELFNRKGRVDVIGCDDGRRVLAVLMQNVSEVRRVRRSTHDG